MALRSVDEAYMAERVALIGTQEARPRLKERGPDDTLPPVSKDDNLKGRVDLLQTLVIAFIAGLLALAAGVVAAVNGTNTRIDAVQKTTADLNREVGTIGAKIDESNHRLDRIERQLERIGKRR